MDLAEFLKLKRADILRVAEKHGAHNVRLFGSVVRGEVRPESDVDLLVEMDHGRSLLDLVPGGQGTQSVPNMDHFCLGIDAADVGLVQRYLQAQGVEIAGGPMNVYGARGTGTSLYVRDPEHNTIELKLLRGPDPE